SGDAFRAILNFHDQLAGRGIHLMVVPTPGKPALYGDKLTPRVNNGSTGSHTRALISRLRAAGVETFDLFDLFGDRAAASTPWYLLRDTHWSGEAASIAAGRVAVRLKELGWAMGAGHRYEVRPVRVRRASDIVKMTQAPRIEALFPAEEVW